jgi:hypothetical protein
LNKLLVKEAVAKIHFFPYFHKKVFNKKRRSTPRTHHFGMKQPATMQLERFDEFFLLSLQIREI